MQDITSKYQIYNADCIDVLSSLEDNLINLVVTSPPYNSLRTYEGTCEWNFDIFKVIANILKAKITEGGTIVWIVNDGTIDGSESGSSFRQALYFKEIGFKLHDTMIWSKSTVSFPDSTRYLQSFEYMFVLTKGSIKTYNILRDRKNKWPRTDTHGTYREKDGSIKKRTRVFHIGEYGLRKNIWEINSINTTTERTGHPAQFPIKLAKDHILTWSNKDDIICDPFMGSGTTGEACMLHQRQFIGMEKVEKYYKIAKQRIDKAYKSLVNTTWRSKVKQ